MMGGKHKYREVEQSSVLDADKHRAIINDIDRLCERAGIPIWAVCRPLSDVCSPVEVEWVRGFHAQRRENHGGLVLSGARPDVEVGMAAMAGAYIRNYIDAQVMVVHRVLRALSEGDSLKSSVLLIPNFYVRKEDGGHLATWEIPSLLGLLMERHSMGKLTVLYVQSMGALQRDWGTAMHQHLKSYYTIIEAGA